jgi:hypothetical protein
MTDIVDPFVTKARDTPGIFVNRFWISVNQATTRIVLGDAVWGTDAAPRSAVVMHTSDAATLAQLILDTIKKHQEFQASQIGTPDDGAH